MTNSQPAPSPAPDPGTSSQKKPSLLAMSPEAMAEALATLGEPKFRAKQIMQWLYKKRVTDFAAMTDLSAGLRARLAESFVTTTASVAAREADAENTTKLALRFPDSSVIESVLMLEMHKGEGGRDELRKTACVSTQAGCAMGCRFCASGQLGLRRHLTAAEIVEQVLAIGAAIPDGGWLTNIVYMGMGEPLHNYEATVASLRTLTSEWGFAMSPRRITVSTVGFPRRIRDLAASGLGVNLAVSLHAPNDRIRSELIPTNEAYGGIDEILAASKEYFEATGRQVTFEYTVVKDANDQTEHARELASVIRKILPGSNINLIPMNPVKMSGLRPPETDQVQVFAQVLEQAGHSVHTRKKKGRSISAACGQLRLRVEEGVA